MVSPPVSPLVYWLMHKRAHLSGWRRWVSWFMLVGLAVLVFWMLRLNLFLGLIGVTTFLKILLDVLFGTERTEDEPHWLTVTSRVMNWVGYVFLAAFILQMMFLTA